ncbi:hypothetical protein SCA6_000431 [Theobroma cacao]
MQRYLIERERRSNMNNLYSKLFSLLPPQPTGSDMKFILGEIISIIEQEGAEVIGATYNHAGKVNRNILSIHCEVACSKIGFKSSKVLERLKTLFGDCM